MQPHGSLIRRKSPPWPSFLNYRLLFRFSLPMFLENHLEIDARSYDQILINLSLFVSIVCTKSVFKECPNTCSDSFDFESGLTYHADTPGGLILH